MSRSVMSIGITCPIIREGDDIVSIVVDSVMKSGHQIDNKDVIGITESVIARSLGKYVSVDDIAEETKKLFGENATIMLYKPIYSRNRFAMILKGIARGAKKLIMIMPYEDEVGNVIRNHPFTGKNYDDYYSEICKAEGCEVVILDDLRGGSTYDKNNFEWWSQNNKDIIDGYLDCTLHNNKFSTLSLHSWYCFYPVYTLYDYFKDLSEFGLLGSNKSTEEKLKLFPNKSDATRICEAVKKALGDKTGKDVIVCCYGDGCFKDAETGIWEFADPVTMPGYTDKTLIESTPNEVKLKALIDDTVDNTGVILKLAEEKENLKGDMKSMGTTPRKFRDLLASLMDLTSGSGDRETPVVLVKNYF